MYLNSVCNIDNPFMVNFFWLHAITMHTLITYMYTVLKWYRNHYLSLFESTWKIHVCSKTALITSWIKIHYYPLANKDARGYSNTTIHHSVLSVQNVSSELSRANIVHRIFTKLGTHILHIALVLSLAYGGNRTLVHKAWSSLSLSIN